MTTTASKTLYNLVNPSDPYTFYAANDEVAAAAAWLLSTAFGASRIDGRGGYGFAMFGVPPHFTEKVGDFGVFLKAHRAEIAEALASMMVGTRSVSDREALDELRARMTPEEWKAFYAKRDDEMRSSMSAIGPRAHYMAEALQKALIEEGNS